MKNKPMTILSAAILSVASIAFGAEFSWKGGNSGFWSDKGNWSPEGVPGNEDAVSFSWNNVKDDTTVAIDSISGISLKSLTISGGGSLIWKGLSSEKRMLNIVNSGSDVKLSGGPFVFDGLDVALKVVNMSPGNNRFLLTGGGSTTNTLLVLKNDATLTLDNTLMLLSGDNNAMGTKVSIRDSAKLDISGSSSLLQLGRGANTWGGIEQRGGFVNSEGVVSFGYNNGGSFGTWEMFAGTNAISADVMFAVGSDSRAGLYIHGGKFTFGGSPFIGCSQTGRADVFIDGGEVSFDGKTMTLVNRASDSIDSPSVLTIAGTARVHGFRILPYGDRNSYQGCSRAMVNLNGESILSLTDTFKVKAVASSSRCTLSFDGGTLERVTGSPDSEQNTSLLSGIDAVVYSGGGKIRARKSDGTASGMILNSAKFRKAGGFGVSSITVTHGGTGYLLPPLVNITGGSGSNATAVAQIDYEKQQVTNVVITCHGEGYKSGDLVNVSFEVPGSPVVSAAVATAHLAENTAGTLWIDDGNDITFGADFEYDGNLSAANANVQIAGDVGFGGDSRFKNLTVKDNGKLMVAGSASAVNVEVKANGCVEVASDGSLNVENYAALYGDIRVACASSSPLVLVVGNCAFANSEEEPTEIIPSANLVSREPIQVISVRGNVNGSIDLGEEGTLRWKLKVKNENGATVYYLVPRQGTVVIFK